MSQRPHFVLPRYLYVVGLAASLAVGAGVLAHGQPGPQAGAASAAPTAGPATTTLVVTTTTAPLVSPTMPVTATATGTAAPPPSPTTAPAPTPSPGPPLLSWSQPDASFVLHADRLTLAVQAPPSNPSSPPIDQVTFKAAWLAQPGVPAGHTVACVARRSTAGPPALYSCAWDARAAGVPNGPLTVAAAALDAVGRAAALPPLPRAVLVAQPQRKAIVLLQGVCTAIGAGTGTDNTTFTALQNLLKTPAYGYADADYLLYSYRGGALDPRGQWVHQPYGLSDPIQQNFHGTSWSALHDALLAPYHRHHPNTTFVLVGHSLGGMVAWEELKRELAAPAGAPLLLSSVVTVDSPLHGIDRPELLLANLLRLFPRVGTRLDCALRGQAARVLLAVHLAPHTSSDLVALANRAVGRGITVTTAGNSDDCVWSPDRCGVPLSGMAATQWVAGSRAHTLIFHLPRPCVRPEAYCFVGTHGAALTNSNGPQALRQIAAAIGPQTPIQR